MSNYLQAGFVIRFKVWYKLICILRKLWLGFFGFKTGKHTSFGKIFITWPHQVSIGSNYTIEQHVYFKFDGIYKPGPSIRIQENVFIGSSCEFNIRKSIDIGNDCLIGSGSRFIDHDHGTNNNSLMRLQPCPEKEIIIQNNVWIGCNVVVLKGVTIHAGAVVAAGSVVLCDIPPYELWGGVPARKLKAL